MNISPIGAVIQSLEPFHPKEKSMDMDIVERIDSCRSFAERHCPHQALMERLYLVYQLFETEQLLRSEACCRHCGDWSSHIFRKSARSCRLSHGNT